MISSVQAYNMTIAGINQPAGGGLPPKTWALFFNEEQIDYLAGLIPPSIDGATNDSISPFIKEYPVPLDQWGKGIWTTGDNAGEPTLWATGYVSPDCGETAQGDSPLVPVKIIRDGQWAAMTLDLVSPASLTNPYARITGATTLECRPTNLGFVTAWYIRNPRPVVVGSYIDNFGVERPLEGATNQVNPEWSDSDVMKIIGMVIARTGLALQSNRMQMEGRRPQ
jgi:hypothetical protein